MRDSRISVSEGGVLAAKVGEDMGDRVVVIVKRPSKGRSGRGVVTSAVM